MYENAPPCKANISQAGRRRRLRFGTLWLGISLALLAAIALFRTPWYCGLALFVPGSLSAVGFLQVRRNTCIARAAEGSFEHDDFSTDRAPTADVAASRAVALGIRRDTILLGVASAAVGVVAALFVRTL